MSEPQHATETARNEMRSILGEVHAILEAALNALESKTSLKEQ